MTTHADNAETFPELYYAINDATGFANGDQFRDAEQARYYMSPEVQRDLWGDQAAGPDQLAEWADAIIDNGWHMVDEVATNDIYEELKQAGCTIEHHESDLYIQVDETSKNILKKHPEIDKTRFTGTDGKAWFELAFMYTPWWNDRIPDGKPLNPRERETGDTR
jgi:hypothetical protein